MGGSLDMVRAILKEEGLQGLFAGAVHMVHRKKGGVACHILVYIFVFVFFFVLQHSIYTTRACPGGYVDMSQIRGHR